MDKLEKEGYAEGHKAFQGKMPLTTYSITKTGRNALRQYWSDLEAIRHLGEPQRSDLQRKGE